MFTNPSASLGWTAPQRALESPIIASLLDGALQSDPSLRLFDHSNSLASFSATVDRSSRAESRSVVTSLDQAGNEAQLVLSDFSLAQLGFDRAGNFNAPSFGQPQELVVIDRGVSGWEALADDLRNQQRAGRAVAFLVLDNRSDGLEQITNWLAGYREVAAVHLVSHAVDGAVQLGNGWLSAGALPGRVNELLSWRDALANDADILMYGCNLAAGRDGQSLVDGLAALTGADVAASSDLTGYAGLGGDWAFEYQIGLVDSRAVFTSAAQFGWQQILDGSININAAWLSSRGPGPYYLDDDNTNYVLQTDVSTPGTAFAIIAPNITFDLNGHTITYDAATPIPISNGSFEAGAGTTATGWDFSDAAATERFAGLYFSNQIYDGNYSLRFAPSTNNRSVISSSTIALEANTTYSLSGMFNRKNLTGVSLYVELVNTVDQTTYRAEYNGTNNRGIQLHEKIFSTGASGGTYTVKVGVTGAFASGYAFVDDVKVQRTKAYGIAVGAFDWAPADYPGITQFGNANKAIIKNGNIVQGGDKATWGHGFYVRQANDTLLSNVDVTVAGPNASAVMWNSGSNGIIENSDFRSNVQTITKRDNNHGAVVMDFQGTFKGNTIHSGPGVGLYLSDAQANVVYDNTIRLKTKYTNAFAIFARGPDTRVYNNLIDCADGEYSSRGIFVRGTTGIRYVYNNTIRVQGLINNQEYGGAQGDGVYGIQVENDSDAEIYNNSVYVNAKLVQGYAFRGNGITSGINVYGNTFEINSNGAYGAVFKFEGQTTAGLNIHDNNLVTNNGLFGYMESSDITVLRSNITIANPIAGSRLFEGGWVAGPNFHTTVQLLDSVYADAATRDAIAASSFIYYANGNAETRAKFKVSWTTGVHVHDLGGTPIVGAVLTIDDEVGNEVFTDTTNESGDVACVLDEYITQGSTKTIFEDHEITVINEGKETKKAFKANQSQTISMVADGRTPDDYTLEYQGNKLLVHATDLYNSVEWTAANPLQFKIDGFSFDIMEGTNEIVFLGYAGNDSIQMVGSAGNDSLLATPGDATLILSTGFVVRADNFEQICVDSGGGIADASQLDGSTGADTFWSSASAAYLSGTGFRIDVSGFDSVAAYGKGGNDIATLYDSAGDDSLVARPTYVTFSGNGFANSAYGFDQTCAYSSAGGVDGAVLYDSSGVDTLYGGPNSVRLYGTNFSNSATGFRTVTANSALNRTVDRVQFNGSAAREISLRRGSAQFLTGVRSIDAFGFENHIIQGGPASAAVVKLYGSNGNDTLNAQTTQTALTGDNYYHRVIGFPCVRALAVAGGVDVAFLYDSVGDDTFWANPTWARLNGDGFAYEASGFGRVVATSSAYETGDVANFQDSSGLETLIGRSTFAALSGTGFENRANNFSRTAATSTGGNDVAFLYDTVGNDTLEGDLSSVCQFGTGYSHTASAFQRVIASGTAGGVDLLNLSDSVGDDSLTAGDGSAVFIGLNSQITATGFETQQFNSVNGGNDSVMLNTGAGANHLAMYERYSVMTGSGYTNRVDGFREIEAVATFGGGINSATLLGDESAETMDFYANYGWARCTNWSRKFTGFDWASVSYCLADDVINLGSIDFDLDLNGS